MKEKNYTHIITETWTKLTFLKDIDNYKTHFLYRIQHTSLLNRKLECMLDAWRVILVVLQSSSGNKEGENIIYHNYHNYHNYHF